MKGLTEDIKKKRELVIKALGEPACWKPDLQFLARRSGLSTKSVAKYLQILENDPKRPRITMTATWPAKR